jgi:hypothetical protein
MLFLAMIYWLLIILIPVILISASFIKGRLAEKKTLARIREQWGQPKYIHRNFKLIAAYLTAFGGEYAASAADLDLDDVFTGPRPNRGSNTCLKNFIRPKYPRTILHPLNNGQKNLLKTLNCGN